MNIFEAPARDAVTVGINNTSAQYGPFTPGTVTAGWAEAVTQCKTLGGAKLRPTVGVYNWAVGQHLDLTFPIQIDGDLSYLGDTSTGVVINVNTSDYGIKLKQSFEILKNIKVVQAGSGDCIVTDSADGSNPISNCLLQNVQTSGGKYGFHTLDTAIITFIKSLLMGCEFRSTTAGGAGCRIYGNENTLVTCAARLGVDGFQDVSPSGLPQSGGDNYYGCIGEGNSAYDFHLITSNSSVLHGCWSESTCTAGIYLDWNNNAQGSHVQIDDPNLAGTYTNSSGNAAILINSNVNFYVRALKANQPALTSGASNLFGAYQPTDGAIGKITNPVGSTGGTTIGLWGTGTAVVASTDYQVIGNHLLLTSTGGTGVSITIKDPAGNTVQSGLATLTAQYIPIAYKVNFGAFSVAPTLTAFGAGGLG